MVENGLDWVPMVLGVAGFLVYATADILLSLRHLNSEGITYYVLCGLAAILIGTSLIFDFNLGALLTELFCLSTCILAIVLRLRARVPA